MAVRRGQSDLCRRHRSAARRGAAWPVILGAAALIAMAALAVLFLMFRGDGDGSGGGPLLYTVAKGPFDHDLVVRGEVEGAESLELRCEVKARSATSRIEIIDVVPDRSIVKKGDPLVWLDSSALENERVQQQIVCYNKKAAMIEAESLLKAATATRDEYAVGTYKLLEQAIEGEIFVAEENLRRAREYAEYSERLAAKGYVTAVQLEGDRFAVDKAAKNLEEARTKLQVLQQHTKQTDAEQLEANVKIAEAKWEAAKKSYELEQNRLTEIDEQIEKCIIRAPRDGQIVYANHASSRDSSEFIVEQGAMVRERQIIIVMPEPEKMQIEAKINESRVGLVKEGMEATIHTVDASSNGPMKGTIIQVNENPEPQSWHSSYIKEYVTKIRVDDPTPTLRPGYTAMVTIHIRHIDNAIQVPVQTVLVRGKSRYCLVRRGGVWEAREVTVGAINSKFAVVDKGLASGEQVAMDPDKYSDQVDLPEAPQGPQRGRSAGSHLAGASTRSI